MLTRRQAVIGAAAAGCAAALRPTLIGSVQAEALAPRLAPRSGRTVPVSFDVAERATALPCFGGKALPLWTFQEGAEFPVVRLTLGDRLAVRVKNSLTRPGEHVTIHWHGLRIANREDGVPYMTQAPILPGAEGSYNFAPPDTGTFFFHTHCNAVEHFGRGLMGALIVEGDEAVPSDQDLVLIMKDWRIGDDGNFLPFSLEEGQAKGGTPGTVRSINGATQPTLKVAAGADIRLRVLDLDPTRICEIGIEGAEASVIAIDGNACLPFALSSWRMGTAQRLDILMRSPKPGAKAQLVDYFSPSPIVLAEFASEGPPKRKGSFRVHPLRAGRFAEPDLKNAERVTFELSQTATAEAVTEFAAAAGIEIGSLCLTKRTFWAINKQSWASVDHRDSGPPLAALKLGRSYIFEFKNLTSHAHPIHIHGHSFAFLSSNLRKFPPHRADTILVLPKERVEVAFVADNPGRWMLHCHIIEHQETGMMGYFTVS